MPAVATSLLRSQGLAAGFIGTYMTMDFHRWKAQEKRIRRRHEIQRALWYKRAELLENFHDFKTDMQKQSAKQLTTDSTKLAIGVIPGVAVFGDAADVVNNAANLHDLYELMGELHDVAGLTSEEEAKLIGILVRNDHGKRVLQSKLDIAQLETELATLTSDFWPGHSYLESDWNWFMPLTFHRWLFKSLQVVPTTDSLRDAEADDKYAKVFALVDRDNDGSIDKLEFKRALRALELIDTQWRGLANGDAAAFFLGADADKDGKINVEDFALWIKTTRELIECFNSLDSNEDGLIDVTEFREALRKLSASIHPGQGAGVGTHPQESRDVEAEFKDIDQNRDGHISLLEFVGWVHAPSQRSALHGALQRANFTSAQGLRSLKECMSNLLPRWTK